MGAPTKSNSFSRRSLALAVAAAFLPHTGLAQNTQNQNQNQNQKSETRANTLPTNGQVTAGSATIDKRGLTLQIDQRSDKAILQWDSFSIGSRAQVNFTQPSASSIALNKVNGNNPSEIFGRLTANGQVFLSNPSGVLFAPGASVDVGALFATSLAISDQDFMAGRYLWSNSGSAGSVKVDSGAIINANSYAVLAGPKVRNDGLIVARSGTVALAAGNRVSLDMLGDGLISVSVDQAALNASAINAGTIESNGGNVLLTARSANALLDTVVNNSGIIRATALVERNGEIVLDGGSGGVVNTGGITSANGPITVSGGSLTNNGTISNSGGSSTTLLMGDRFSLAGGTIENGSGAVAIRPRIGTNSFGIEDTSQATNLTNADMASVHTTGFLVLGSGLLNNFTGNMSIGVDRQVDGGGKDLAFLRSQNAAGTTRVGAHGLTTMGDVLVSGGGGAIVGTGAIGGDQIQLRAAAGIGTAAERVRTAANALAIGTGGSAFVSEANDVTLRTVALNIGGIDNVIGTSTNGLDFAAGGAVNVMGDVSSRGTMKLDVGGALSVIGNPGAPANLTAQTGQMITARSIDVRSQGATAAIINSAGDQTISVNGGGTSSGIDVRTLTPGGIAQILNSSPLGVQRITVTGADHINVNAGFANAGIQANGTQDISITGTAPGTGNITLANSSSDFLNSFAGVQAPKQTIAASGDVTLTANLATGTTQGVRIGAFGGAADLSLTARDVILTGGSGAGNGVGIGTSQGAALTNNISINATRDVILNSGPGGSARIGNGPSALAGGNIAVTAGGSIQLNGTAQQTAIRTLGNVTLEAASISETANGLIIANTLNTTSNGSTTLTGPNQVANYSGMTRTVGDLSLVNNGALSVTNLSAAGNARLTNSGDVTVSGPWNSLLATSISTVGAGSDLTVNRSVNSTGPMNLNIDGALSVIGIPGAPANLTAQTGQTISARSIDVRSQGSTAAIINSGGDQTITVNGGGASSGIDVRTLSTGGIAQILNSSPLGAQRITVTGADHINVNAGLANAEILANGTQNISITGGAPGTGNITLANSNSGFLDSFAGVRAPRQIIAASGDVTLQANLATGTTPGARIGAFGGAADLTLTARDVIFTGGSIGTSQSAALTNNISINATRDVILNSGPGGGARIGNGPSALAGGNIAVMAGGSIQLNGTGQATAIRTLGNVTLEAASISEAANGFIIANTLNTTSNGNTTLTGPNQVANYTGWTRTVGDLSLVNNGALTVTNLSAAGNARLTNSGDVTVNGPWSSLLATSISTVGAGSDLTVNRFVNSTGPMNLNIDGAVRVSASGLQDASLTSFGGQNINARSLEVTSRDGRFASIGNNNAGNQTITVSGGGGVDIQSVSGGGVAYITNSGTGNQTISVSDGSGISVRSVSGGGSGQIDNYSGNQTISVSGGSGIDVETLSGNGFALIFNGGSGNQTISVSGGSGIGVRSASNGGIGQIGNFGSGAQTINVSGGTGIDVQANAGGAFINQSAPDLAQIITATNADHINVNGVGGNAFISANGGAQTLSITGSGSNAITLGSLGALGFSLLSGGYTQNVTAGVPGEWGSITIVGPAANNSAASIVSRTSGYGSQTIETSGLLSITGGTAPNQVNAAGIFHNNSGQQTVRAAALELRGGPSGAGNGALLNAGGGGDLANAGNQLFHISGDINIAGAPGGDAGISGGLANQEQTIFARNISVTNAVGGTNSFGSIRGGRQEIHASGDVRLTAQATNGSDGGVRVGGRTPNPTDLRLYVGGDLVLTGGSAPDNNANIGASGTTAVANTIYIETGGNVILNSGSGSGTRIGSGVSLGGGTIEIHAGGDIRLDGVAQNTAIRSLGTVTLDAANISEAARGLIVAGSLNTTTRGTTSLTGPNEVARFSGSSATGDIHLNNTSPLLMLGNVSAPTGALSINTTGDVIVGGAAATSATLLQAAGDISITTPGSIVLRGSDVASGGSSSVFAGDVLSFAAGNVSLLGGAAASAPAIASGSEVRMTLTGELRLVGGSGSLAPAQIQTETADGKIRLNFPNLASGGYFVNGVEGRISDGGSGLFNLGAPAVLGSTLLTVY
jgi:filamentous hemagglutinin family protein